MAFQLYEDLLCMPFDAFHGAVQRVLGRPVWSHEFCTAGTKQLRAEFEGKAEPATLEQIMALIPPEKRVSLVMLGADDD